MIRSRSYSKSQQSAISFGCFCSNSQRQRSMYLVNILYQHLESMGWEWWWPTIIPTKLLMDCCSYVNAYQHGYQHQESEDDWYDEERCLEIFRALKVWLHFLLLRLYPCGRIKNLAEEGFNKSDEARDICVNGGSELVTCIKFYRSLLEIAIWTNMRTSHELWEAYHCRDTLQAQPGTRRCTQPPWLI